MQREVPMICPHDNGLCGRCLLEENERLRAALLAWWAWMGCEHSGCCRQQEIAIEVTANALEDFPRPTPACGPAFAGDVA